MSYDPYGSYGQYAAGGADQAAGAYTQQASYAAPTYPPSQYSAPAAAPAYGGPPPYYPPGGAGSDEVRTIFITGFPPDVKERELNNLLRFLPGYEASQMNWKNGQAQGFALFHNGQFARAAVDTMSQLVFDEGAMLRAEMARKNMYIKASGMDDPNKRPRLGPGGFGGGSSYPHAGGPPPFRGGGNSYHAGGPPGGGGGGGQLIDNPPCNTLFVGNLSETINEAELMSLFQPHPGFQRLKIVRGRNTTAFVEYDTTQNAQAVHDMQQGVVLASNADRGGIRVQYSRNPFGKKRDATGILIDTPVRPGDITLTAGSGPTAPLPAPGQAQVKHDTYEPVPYDPNAAAGDAPGQPQQ